MHGCKAWIIKSLSRCGIAAPTIYFFSLKKSCKTAQALTPAIERCSLSVPTISGSTSAYVAFVSIISLHQSAPCKAGKKINFG
jgi:hypothetical protein